MARKKKPVQAVPVEEDSKLEKVKLMYPPRPSFIRKIHYLWPNHYRVNYHDKLNSNFIKESYFVELEPDTHNVEKSNISDKDIEDFLDKL